MNHRPFQLSAFALAVSAVFATPVHSAIITQTTDAQSGADAVGTPGIATDTSSSGYKASNSFASALLGNSSAQAFANQYGAYAVSSYATGIANAGSYAALAYSIFNDSSVAQNLSMTFKIYAGSISTKLDANASLVDAESLISTYSSTIRLNGSSVFDSSAQIRQNSFGIKLTRSGVDLSGGTDDGSDGVYSWTSQIITINLGSIGAGQTYNLLGELGHSAGSNVGTYTGDCGVNGGQTLLFAAAEVTSCAGFKGFAAGFYGDPAGILNDTTARLDPAFTFSLTPRSTNVPVPGSLALGLVGLAALAGSRRKG